MDLRKLDRVPAIAAVMTPFPYSVAAEDPVTAAERAARLRLPVGCGCWIWGLVPCR